MTNTQKLLLLPTLGVLLLGGGALLGYASLASAQNADTGEARGFGMLAKAPHVDGTITAISGNTVTISADANHGGGTYTVDATNATVTKAGASATLASFAVGDKVWAFGEISGNNVVATKVSDAMHAGFGPGGRHGRGHGVHGTVTGVTGSSITIDGMNGTTYTIDASSATVQKMVAGSLSDIAVGDEIGVQGEVSGTSITAKAIMDDLPLKNMMGE